MKRLFATLLLAGVAYEACAAGPIYRCGREYSQKPCTDGKLLDVGDPRSAAQRAEAKRVAAQERQQAAEMQRDRLAEKAAEKPASASGFNGRPPAPAASAASAAKSGKNSKKHAKPKHAESSDFVAVEPRTKPRATPR
ncbi:hypothetical protein [Piscinibacter sp.]|jgi:hypothetical protein|uniref:hypothetical protein n=1 Tax=Piscinibacter sp. TaxID=1903157 RepID=UPI003559C69F